MSPTALAPASPRPLGLASLLVALVSAVLGAVGTGVANWATSRNLGIGERAEILLVIAPATLSGLLALVGFVLGILSFRRGGGSRDRTFGGLGGALSFLAGMCAIAWILVVGGLSLLAMFAWH